MPHCAVYGCRNNTRYKYRCPHVRFHSFPSNECLREKWLKFCRRSATFNYKTAAVCSTHFSEDQKQKSMMNRLLGVSPTNARNLVADAVPNINSPDDIELQKEAERSARNFVKNAEVTKESPNNQQSQQNVLDSITLLIPYSGDENLVDHSPLDQHSEQEKEILNSLQVASTVAILSDEIDHEVMATSDSQTLFDFTKLANLNDWIEISDTKRDVGMSKASFVLQKTQKFQRAVFFTMLNPQPNGAGFAGVSSRSTFDLSKFNNIDLHARAQGSTPDYKIVLRHKGENEEPHPTYEQFFTMPLNEFTTVSLPLSNFDPYYRGRKLNSSEAEPLDKSQISSFGFQVYGGVFHPTKRSGISALEVDWVKAS